VLRGHASEAAPRAMIGARRAKDVCAGAIAALCLLASASVHAQRAVKPAAYRLEGFAPDAQFVGGVGFGVGAKLKNYFLARGRLGLLYADEPWMANLGAIVEIGALGRFGAGAELELNADRGLFGAVGLARVTGKDWMSHISVGFTVLGLEWQHRFGDERPSDALLFEVRLPIGTWWFVKQHEPPAATQPPKPFAGPLQPQVFTPRPPPSAATAPTLVPAPNAGTVSTPEGTLPPSEVAPAAGAAAAGGPPPSAASGGKLAAGADAAAQARPSSAASGVAAAQARSPSGAVSSAPAGVPARLPAAGVVPSSAPRQTAVLVPPAPDPARVQEAHALAEQARAAQARGQSGDAALLLARAYALSPEPAIALQLSAAEEAHGRWLLAAGDLRRLLAAHTLPEAEQRRVSEQLAQLEARTPKLRLMLEHAAGDEVITIDGADAPAAGLGYDIAVDPGEHALRVSRRGRELARSSFSASAGKLTRVALDLSAAP
jgi:hypothetical protein